MHKFYSASRYYVNMTLTLTHCSFANGPHYGHWNQALNRDARKVRSLRKAYRRFYAVIFATSRQPHRSRFRARRFSFCTVSTLPLYRQGFTMILDEDLYPPRHKTVVKFRYVTHRLRKFASRCALTLRAFYLYRVLAYLAVCDNFERTISLHNYFIYFY